MLLRIVVVVAGFILQLVINFCFLFLLNHGKNNDKIILHILKSLQLVLPATGFNLPKAKAVNSIFFTPRHFPRLP